MKPTLQTILNETLLVEKMTKENYRATRKTKLQRAIEVKQIICYVGTRYGYTNYQIAKFLGIDHSTVCHHNSTAEGYFSYDKNFSHKVNMVMSKFEKVCFYHKLNGYIARERDSQKLYFFSETPKDIDGVWQHDSAQTYELFEEYFPQISYRDSPRSCELTLRIK